MRGLDSFVTGEDIPSGLPMLKKARDLARFGRLEGGVMRGEDVFQDELFSYGGIRERAAAKHFLRRIAVAAFEVCLSNTSQVKA